MSPARTFRVCSFPYQPSLFRPLGRCVRAGHGHGAEMDANDDEAERQQLRLPEEKEAKTP